MGLAPGRFRTYWWSRMVTFLLRVLPVVILIALQGCAVFDASAPGPAHAPRGTVADTARSQLGTPYVAGGNNPGQGFDCSGLVQWCYSVHGYKLPRRTEDQLSIGTPVKKNELAPGDLVFFNVSRKRWGLHVGVYTGRGRFVHSPTPGSRVREEDLSMHYWVRTYIGARRILPASNP